MGVLHSQSNMADLKWVFCKLTEAALVTLVLVMLGMM